MSFAANRAKVTTATTGAGTISLGSPLSGFQSFAAAGVPDGASVRYAIEDGSSWEIGLGTYSSSGATLTRNPSESSNSDAPIQLSGSAVVYVTLSAEDIEDLQSQNVKLLSNVSALLSDTVLTYVDGSVNTVATGDVIQTRSEGFSYQVASSGASNQHATTAGGVKLYVI